MLKRIIAMLIFSIIAACIFITCKNTKAHDDRSSALISKYARPLTNIHIEFSTERLERGKYLVNGVLRCFHCHAEADKTKAGWPPFADKLGSGEIFYQTDSTRFCAPNISPDKETGAGTWTDDMFIRVLRDGIGHDGRALTTMPWWIYKRLSDEDLASVIVYLRSLPPVKNKLPQRLLPVEEEQALQNEPREMKDVSVPQTDTSTLLAKGRYLVTIGECEGCHTAWYKRNPGFFGGGNIIANGGTDSVVVSGNISPDITGIGSWTSETFIRIMRTGKGGTLHHSMPWREFSNISDTDLSAILVALKQLNPVEHNIANGLKPTFCEVCGQKHGYGDRNKIKPIVAVPFNTDLYPSYTGSYADSHLDGTMIISVKDQKLWISVKEMEDTPAMELIPIKENKFKADAFPSAISFVKNKSGETTGLIIYDLTTDTLARIK
ncbi:MAG TPA: c-type cytochrome [Ginsengibacter sp.]|nr:c-type cytochrome [Ginsengibacter sp.]